MSNELFNAIVAPMDASPTQPDDELDDARESWDPGQCYRFHQ